jgi:hypothetical protein
VGNPFVDGHGALNALAAATAGPMDFSQSAAGLQPAKKGAMVSLAPTSPVDTWNTALWSGITAAPQASWSFDGSTWSGSDWNGWALEGRAWNEGGWNNGGWNGAAWDGSAWSGSAWDGTGWSGSAWQGSAWSGSAWSGSAWS